MVQSSTSSGDQFAQAIRKADPRSRAGINPAVPQTDIQHGHEHDPMNELPPKWAGEAAKTGLPPELIPGMPRNADGSKRTD
jgi:hypothetical protein